MAKKRFDRIQVVDRAVKLFWQNGFHATSMQQVTMVTGLNPGSIYLEFGNKEGLFMAALERYAELEIARLQTTLESTDTVGEGICLWLDDALDATQDFDYCSCFLVKSQLELAADKGPLYDFAKRKLAQVERRIYQYLLNELGDDQARSCAKSVVLHLFGVRVYGYQSDDIASVRDGLAHGLSWLPWQAAPYASACDQYEASVA